MTPGLLLSYYGDDFTGSTDVMEVMQVNGLDTVLFLQPPSGDQLERFAHCRVIGIAGTSRSQSPEWMSANLPAVFESIRAMGAKLCQYKVCSTFDSAPHSGSIGRALEIGLKVFAPRWVPIVAGAPALGRYTAFGHLFARVGRDVHRIDRHPTMSRHPVTPMLESDLRLHLAQQTSGKVELVDILALRRGEVETPAGAALVDILDEQSLVEAGRLIWTTQPEFMIGSSGIEYALAAYWRSEGMLGAVEPMPPARSVDRLIVVSGSCSPVTEAQIRWAETNGFAGFRLDAGAMASGDEAASQLDPALAALREGCSVVLYSALGAPEQSATREFQHALGRAQGRLLRQLLQRSGIRRAVVCGGDTSGHACQQLGIYALSVVTPMAPGSPLCRAWSEELDWDGLEILLKGGQLGREWLFEQVRSGTMPGWTAGA